MECGDGSPRFASAASSPFRGCHPGGECAFAEGEAPRDGRFIEVIGTYDPKGKTAADKVKVDAEKARQWIRNGATPSDTVQSLLKQAGVFQTASA